MNSRELLESSQRWTAEGLAAFSRNDGSNDFAVHHLGVALEHLLKACLAGLHPALIVDPEDWPSLLHATGHGDRSGIRRSRTKTIGLSIALERVKKLILKITVNQAELPRSCTHEMG